MKNGILYLEVEKMRKRLLFTTFLAGGAILTLAPATNAKSYVEFGDVSGVDMSEVLGFRDITDSTTEYKVTDSSETSSSQPYNEVDLSDFGKSISQIRAEGYKTVVVIFELDIKEVKDGYQELFLYDGSGSNASQLVAPITSFEHGSGYRNTSYSRYEFYAEIPAESFCNSVFTMRYGAHGKYDDDWKYRDLQMEIALSYEDKKIDGLQWVENADTYHY